MRSPHPARLRRATLPLQGRVKQKNSVLAMRFSHPSFVKQRTRTASPTKKGEAERRKAQVDLPRPARKRCRLHDVARGARPFWETRSPSGALPRLSPKALRPKAQSGPALHGRGQQIRAPGSQLLADRRSGRRGEFPNRPGRGYEPRPGHRARSTIGRHRLTSLRRASGGASICCGAALFKKFLRRRYRSDLTNVFVSSPNEVCTPRHAKSRKRSARFPLTH